MIIDSQDKMVIGRDLMDVLGIVLNFKDKVVQWDGHQTSLNTGGSGTTLIRADTRDREFPDEYKEVVDNGVHRTGLMPDHLPTPLTARVLKLLKEHQLLYDGHLERMRFDDYVLPLSTDFRVVHASPYALPRSMEAKAKDEIQRLLDANVLEQIYDSEMASPAFFITKPIGPLRFRIEFRVLNKYLRRSQYYVPKIREILLRLFGAKFLSTFDANMGYYARHLAKQSRAHSAFCLPFGKYKYKRLPMGISTAPDEYQACMGNIFGDPPFVVVYLDDLLVCSKTESEHLENLRVLFERLAKYDVELNGKKCHIYVSLSTTSALHSQLRAFYTSEEDPSNQQDRRSSQQERAASLPGHDQLLLRYDPQQVSTMCAAEPLHELQNRIHMDAKRHRRVPRRPKGVCGSCVAGVP